MYKLFFSNQCLKPVVFLLFCVAGLVSAPAVASASELEQRVANILSKTALIDGHNDLSWEIKDRFNSELDKVNLHSDTSLLAAPEHLLPLMTDIQRLRAGKLGGQFWSVWIPPEITGADAVKLTLEQIDLVKSMVSRYPEDLQMAYTVDDIVRIHRQGQIASLIGVEGGHQIDGSVAILRQLYTLGVRYLTLTHTLSNAWADSATDHTRHDGLSSMGQQLIAEMNKLGMMVDLSHVSDAVMHQVLDITQAPVIFSHSNAKALTSNARNVSDAVLQRLRENRGIIMVTFYPGFVSESWYQWAEAKEKARQRLLATGKNAVSEETVKAAMSQWLENNAEPVVTIPMVADHIDYIRTLAGIESVGLGSDFDGIDVVPEGLEGPQGFPALLIELLKRGWSDEDVAKLAGGNIMRVMREVEETARRQQQNR